MLSRVATLSLALSVLAGCTPQVVPPTDLPLPIATPTPMVTAAAIPAPDEIVLRMTVDEFPSPATLVEPPDFNLYADGHLIYVQKLGQDSFEMREARLQPNAVSALLAEAEAVLGGARDRYDYFDNQHSSSTTFDLRSPTLNKTVSIYALEVPNVDPPSEADRALIRPLRSRLLLIDMDVRANDSYIGPYEPEAYLAVAYVDGRRLLANGPTRQRACDDPSRARRRAPVRRRQLPDRAGPGR